MILTIHLYNQMILERHKVGNIHPYDMLTTKTHPKSIAMKLFPKSLLGNGHRLPVLDSVVFNSSISLSVSSSPARKRRRSRPSQALPKGWMFGYLFWG